jgi:hypothetical protein
VLLGFQITCHPGGLFAACTNIVNDGQLEKAILLILVTLVGIQTRSKLALLKNAATPIFLTLGGISASLKLGKWESA